MKITALKVSIEKIPLKESFTITLGTIDYSHSVVVEMQTDEGIVGYGEGAPSPLITGETIPGTVASLELLEHHLIGQNPLDREQIHHIINKFTAFAPAAKAAIDIACHDIMAKFSRLSVSQLVGGYRSFVETDMTIGIGKLEDMVQKAREIQSLGFSAIKVKVGMDDQLDIKRVRAIREAVGSRMLLRLDANQAWTDKQAVTMIERLSDYDIELVEQPVKKQNISGLKYVRDRVSVPIMADESCFTVNDACRLIQMEAVDLINIKLMKCGGIYEAMKINTVCEASGIACMIGCMAEESNIGVTAAAHVASGLKNITRADLDATFFLQDTVYTGGVSLEPTVLISVADKEGIGIGERK